MATFFPRGRLDRTPHPAEREAEAPAPPDHRRGGVHRLAPRRRARRARRQGGPARRPQHRPRARTSSTCSARTHVELVEGSTLDAELVDELDRARPTRACISPRPSGVQLIVDAAARARCSATCAAPTTCFGGRVRHGKRLLFTSTSEVYGKNSIGALPEDADRVLGSRVQVALGVRDREGLRRGARPRPTTATARPTIVVARLFNTVGPRQTRRVRDGAAALRAPGARRRGPDRLRQRHADALLHPRRRHGRRRSCSLLDHDEAVGRRVQRRRREPRSPVIELARRVIERAGSESTRRARALRGGLRRGLRGARAGASRTPRAIRELTGWAPTRTIDDAIDDVILLRAAPDGAGRSAACPLRRGC